MKIAVTDFDGTLKPFDDRIPPSTIDAIHQWRAAGNKFGIATGRELTMLNHDLRHYDITTDFLICVNGAVIFDKDRNVLQSIRIARPLKEHLLSMPLIADTNHAMICFCERRSFSLRSDSDYVPTEIAPPISWTDVIERDDVVQFGIKFPNEEEATAAREVIEHEMPQLRGNQNRIYLDINVRPVDKKFGVENLIRLMDWSNDEIHVIGDDRNDLPMIVGFNGYTVTRAADFMHQAARKVYDSVGDMLLKAMRNS